MMGLFFPNPSPRVHSRNQYTTHRLALNFSGPPRRNSSHSKPSSYNAAGPSSISRRSEVDSNDDSPYRYEGGLKEGFEYHEDLLTSKSNRKGR